MKANLYRASCIAMAALVLGFALTSCISAVNAAGFGPAGGKVSSEGTSTVSITCGAGAATLSFNTIVWHRIGNIVTIDGGIIIASASSCSGTLVLNLGTLPAAGNNMRNYAALAIRVDGWASTLTTTPEALLVFNTNTVSISKIVAGVSTNAGADFVANSIIVLGGSYSTN